MNTRSCAAALGELMANCRSLLVGGLVLLVPWLAAEAQQPGKVYRIGVLFASPAPADTQVGRAFREGLRELGWVEGHTVAIDWRSTDGASERFDALATELVRAGVDVIVTGGTSGTMAAKRATQTIPIVFAAMARPVERGAVASLARPGGNVTGVAFAPEAPSKQFQLLKECDSTNHQDPSRRHEHCG